MKVIRIKGIFSVFYHSISSSFLLHGPQHVIVTRAVVMVLVGALENDCWHSVFNSLNLAQGHVSVPHYPTFVVWRESWVISTNSTSGICAVKMPNEVKRSFDGMSVWVVNGQGR